MNGTITPTHAIGQTIVSEEALKTAYRIVIELSLTAPVREKVLEQLKVEMIKLKQIDLFDEVI